jgi:disease resistance protein RPM1
LSDGEQAGASSHQREIIRRLSLHNSSNANASITERKLLSKVRSLDVFGRADLMMPVLSRFCVLRVLQLEDCSGLDNNHLKDLSNLYLLKFLRLQGLKVTELPESIGKLESLETLDIRGADEYSVIMLPLSFGKLGKLVRLHAESVELPDGVALENMKSLRELVGIRPTLHAMTEIGKLGELKVLELFIKEEPESSSTGNSNELVRTCLQKCPSSLQVLVLRTSISYSLDFMAQIPPGLQTYKSDGYFMAFPRWIDPTLSYLTILSIVLWCVRVQPEHLDKLAGLPSLRFLRIRALFPPDEQEKLVIHSSPSSFPCLTDLRIFCRLMFLKFRPGAMRKLQRFCLRFDARKTAEHFRTNTFDYGFENLPSLQHVVIPEGKSSQLALPKRMMLLGRQLMIIPTILRSIFPIHKNRRMEAAYGICRSSCACYGVRG